MFHYQIGDVHLHYQGAYPLIQDGYMSLFSVESSPALSADTIRYQIDFQPLDHFRDAVVVYSNGICWLMESDGERYLMYPWARRKFGYAFSLASLTGGDTVRCRMDPGVLDQIPLTDSRFFSTAGLHSKLLQRNAAVLHASYIEYKGRAILFTAPSGVGKSTQADLWHRHAGAEILNGDRVLLRKRDDCWHAYGYPCCGSSKICVNRTLPLAAIVMLSQGAENQIEPLPRGQQVRALFRGIEHYLWDADETELSLAIAGQLAGEVPVLHLVCRPDEDAVVSLHKYLEKEGLL